MERFLIFIKSFIVSLLLLIVNLVITPVDSVLEVLPPLGFKSSIKLYSLPLLTMTKGDSAVDNRLLIRYDFPT